MMLAFAWQNLITRPSRTALAIVGLTIPIIAFLGLFSISEGIRDLVGGVLGKIQGLMVVRQNAPGPMFSDLSADMTRTLQKIPGVRLVAPEVWKIAPPIDGKGGLGSAAIGLLTRSRESALRNIAGMLLVQGQDLPSHLKLTNPLFALSLLPPELGGGRFLNLDDIGKRNVVISTKIARDFPNADGSPKKVGQTIRIGSDAFTIVGLYETHSLITDMTIVMDIGTARQLYRLSDEAVSAFTVEPARLADADTLTDRIEAALPGVHAQRISQYSVTVGAIMGRLELFLLLAVALALLVGGVGIANTMLMSTSERYLEFGVMRSNGWTRQNILLLVITESALLGLLAGAIACTAAAACVFMANHMLTQFALDLRPWLVVASLAGALLIAVLAGFYPAWKGSTMTPMDAIRHSGAA
jgi:putative ABC transport system permease protein